MKKYNNRKDILLFACLSFMTFCSLNCGFKQTNKSVNKNNINDSQQSMIKSITFDKYEIIVPENYNVREGDSEYPEFIEINNADHSVLITYNADIKDINSPIFDGLNSIKKIYEKQEKINEIGNYELWIAFNNTDSKFRDVKGKVFILDESNTIELLNLSFDSKHLVEVIEMLKQLKYK